MTLPKVVVLLLWTLITSTDAIHHTTSSPRLLLSAVASNNKKHNDNVQFSDKDDITSIEVLRGGGAKNDCDDPNPIIAGKTAISVALQSMGLLAIFKLAEVIAPSVEDVFDKIKIPTTKLFDLSIIQWIASIFCIFSSSTIKSWIEGGIGAATNQVLKPNIVPGDPEWYANLKKPWFNPPGWLFPIMWIIVSKPTQLVAVSKILKASSSSPYWPTLAVYCTHLALGDAWNNVFFGCQKIGLGAYVISTFYGMLLISTKLFANVDRTAGLFLLPTCGWVTIASALNLSIYMLNKK